MRLYFVLLSIHFKLITMQEFGADFWTSLGADANFAHNYNGVYTFDKNDIDYNLVYNLGQNKRRQYKSDISEYNKLAADMPKNSKELYYVFLNKGYPRYMPLNENERPKVGHAFYNINGQDMPMGWPYEDQSRNLYNNKEKRNQRKPRNYVKQRECYKKPAKTYRPTKMEQKAYTTFFNYEHENDVHNFPHYGRQKNYKKFFNHGIRYEGDADTNCNQNIKQKFQRNDVIRKQTIPNDFNPKQFYANNVGNIQKNTIHVGSLAQNLVLLGKKKDCNLNYEEIGSVQHNNNEYMKQFGSTSKPVADILKEELLGSSLGETSQKTIEPTTTTTTTTATASDQPKLGVPSQLSNNKPANTEQNYFTIQGGVVKVSPLIDAEIQALEDPTIFDFFLRKISQLDKVVGTGTTTMMPQTLTDSPIYYIKPIKKLKTTKKPKLPPQVPIKETQTPIPPLSSATTVVPFNAIEMQTSPYVPDDLVQNSETTATSAEITTEAILSQELSTETNINLNEESTSSELEQIVTSTEQDNSLDTNTDLKPSEDKIFEYVAKLHENVLEPQNAPTIIKHMEPIAYETILMKPKPNEKRKNKKLTKRYLSKPKRNVQLRALNPNRPPRPSKKKTTTTTTTTKAPEMNVPKLHFKYSKDDGNKEYEKPTKKTYNRVQVKKAEKTQATYRADSNPTKKSYKKFYDKNVTETQDSHVLGSSSFFTNDEEDPCQENNLEIDDEVSVDADEPIDDEHNIEQHNQSDEFGNHEQELHIAELNNMGRDCDDSNEVTYDGDQYFQNIDSVTPAPLQPFNELCAN